MPCFYFMRLMSHVYERFTCLFPPPAFFPILSPPKVDYSCEQWLVKNMDPLNDNVVQLLANSSDWFVAQLWRDTANVVGIQPSEGAAAAGKFGVQKTRKGMFRTVGQLYKVRHGQ